MRSRGRRPGSRGGKKNLGWPELYASLADALGWAWTYRDIDELTIPQYDEIQKRLRLHPPAHWLAAAELGYKPPVEVAAGTPNAPERAHTIAELRARFPDKMMRA